MWCMKSSVVTAEEKVDGIRFSGTEGLGDRPTDPRRGCGRAKRVEIANLVEADVAFDIFCELYRIAWVHRSG